MIAGIAIGISIVSIVISIVIYKSLKKEIEKVKERPIGENLDVQKITMGGFEIKVVNGELSFTPKK